MKNTIFKNYKKIIISIMLVSVFVLSSVMLSGCSNQNPPEFDNTYKPPIYNTTNEEQKAIIILPGIVGSNLINNETSEPIWSGGALMNNLLLVKGKLDMNQVTNFFKNFLYKDENGKSTVPIRAANMNDQYLQYGIIDEYRNLYKFFYENYGEGNKTLTDKGKEYKVVVYQYDWTKSCVESAKDLETFINANKYTNNVLVGHSMGGLVIDYYLASNDANLTKTHKFISLGTPHYGAMDTAMLAFGEPNLDLTGLTSPAQIENLIKKLTGLTQDDLKGMLGSFDGIGLEEKIPDEYITVDENGVKKVDMLKFGGDMLTSVLSMVKTMPSLYDLLPSREMMSNITVDGVNLSYDDFIQKAFNTPNIKDSKQAKTALNNAVNNRQKLYKGGEFITNKLGDNKVSYVAGKGRKDTLTTKSINFTTKENDHKLYITIDIELSDLNRSTYYGDSMVPILSSTIGKNASDFNVFVLDDFDHIDLYTPVSTKEGTHFLPIMVPNNLGIILKNEIM